MKKDLIYWIPIVGIFLPILFHQKIDSKIFSLQKYTWLYWWFYQYICGITLMGLTNLI